MTGFFSPNLQILSTWKSTLQVAFQKLGQSAFAVNNTFEFQKFDPQLTFYGCPTVISISEARYCLIGKLLIFRVFVTATMTPPPVITAFSFVLPNNLTARTADADESIQAFQSGGCRLTNGATGDGHWWIFPNQNLVNVQRFDNTLVAGLIETGIIGMIEVN